MVKDQDRLVAEMAVRSLANFIKAKDFANLLEEFEECTDFIKYDIVDMIGYIGFKRKLSDDVIKERMQEILSKLKKDSRAVYSTYPKERNFYEQIPEDLEHILQRCIFELYYPIHDDRQEIVLNLLKENKDKIKDESFYIFGSYIESLYGNDDVNVYQEWLEENGSRENEAIILYLRAVWEVALSDYEVSNKRALRYAKKALKCAKDIPAIYHLIGRLTSPDTDYYIELKEKVKQHTRYVALHEIDDIPFEQLYSYETFLQMDILKKIAKPKDFSCICIEEDYEKFWNWGLEKSVFGEWTKSVK